MEDLWGINNARARRHSRTILTWREVYRGPQGQISGKQYSHLNVPHRQLGFSWAVFNCSETMKRDALLLWRSARENAINILTLTLLETMLRFFLKLFSIIKRKQLRNKTRLALQPLNPFYDYKQNLYSINKIFNQNKQKQSSGKGSEITINGTLTIPWRQKTSGATA